MKIEFLNYPCNESFARATVAAFIVELDPTLEEIIEIKTGVSEAVSNSIIHGYEDGKDGIVCLECEIKDNRLIIISVIDYGIGISDIEKAREPLFTTGNTEERSGMGFTVMESFMDKVVVESEIGKGTKVTMYKKLDFCYES